MSNKERYAARSADEKAQYDGYTDHIEPIGVKLPRTKLGNLARAKALKDGRVVTNKTARIGGKAPLTPGEQKTKDHLDKQLANRS